MNGGEVSAAERCANCDAPLTGKYCAACGQRHEPHIHSIVEFSHEAAENITHADSRVWRTLWPLLVKPGFLTREFLEGRRARYLPPFRLYLVLSVVFFLVAAAVNQSDVRLLKVEGGLELGADDGPPKVVIEKVTPDPTKPAETREQRAHRLCDDMKVQGVAGADYLSPRLRRACFKAVEDNGRELLQSLYHNVPRALIVLLPLLALAMRVMYLKRYYVEHLLFFIHTHSFAYLFLTFYILLIRFIQYGWFFGIATATIIIWIPYYTYRAMLRVYAQRKWLTWIKFWMLTFWYTVLSTIMALVLSFYTMVTL